MVWYLAHTILNITYSPEVTKLRWSDNRNQIKFSKFEFHPKLNNLFGESDFDKENQLKVALNVKRRASSGDFGTYSSSEQRMLRRACTSAQSRQSLRFSHTHSMVVGDDAAQQLDL